MTIAEDVAHKLGWIKRDDGYWAYADLDRISGVGFTWDGGDYEVPIFRPDIKPEHTAYAKRDIESRGLSWTCRRARDRFRAISFTVTGLRPCIHVNAESEESICVNAETEEIACCLAFLEIPETKGENDDG